MQVQEIFEKVAVKQLQLAEGKIVRHFLFKVQHLVFDAKTNNIAER